MPEDRGDGPDGEQFRKLFVGGLHFESTEKSVQKYFEQWGEVSDCIVMRDGVTHRSRGFGFVTFKKASMLDDAQHARPHRIDGKDVETKRATPREEAGRPESRVVSKKVYVSGVRDPIEEEDLRQYFSEFGNVEHVDVITDKITGQKRGFAFVTFEDFDSVDKLVLMKTHTIKDQRCDVKKAMTREELQTVREGGEIRGSSRGGRGGGRGGYGGDRRDGGGYSGGGSRDYDDRRRSDSYRGAPRGGGGGYRDDPPPPRDGGYRGRDDYGSRSGGGGGGYRESGGYESRDYGGGRGYRDEGGYAGSYGRDAGGYADRYGGGARDGGRDPYPPPVGGRDSYDDRRGYGASSSVRGYEDRGGAYGGGFGSSYGSSAGGGPIRGGDSYSSRAPGPYSSGDSYGRGGGSYGGGGSSGGYGDGGYGNGGGGHGSDAYGGYSGGGGGGYGGGSGGGYRR